MRTDVHYVNKTVTRPAQKSLRTVQKALGLLRLFVSHGPRLSFQDLATFSRLHRNSVYRLVDTLVEAGFLQGDGRRIYRLGPVLATLGAIVEESRNVRSVALPMLQQLADETAESVQISVVDGDEVVFIEGIDSPQPVRHHIQLGKRQPLHAGASALVLLAYLPTDRVRGILAGPLVAVTPNTVTNPKQLRRELAR